LCYNLQWNKLAHKFGPTPGLQTSLSKLDHVIWLDRKKWVWSKANPRPTQMLKVWLLVNKDSFCRLQRLWPCVGNDNARLAISGATMDSKSENGVATMLICIRGQYGFSCELVP